MGPRTSLALALLLGGCTVEPVEFGEKQCPCDEGFWCDEARDRCVQGERPGADGGPGTDGSPAGDSGEPPGAFGVENLRADWATPNGIRWAWEPIGEESDFAYYELHVSTEEDLSGATVWTADENPELGRFRLPRTGEGDIVVHTITGGLSPDTLHYAQLVAVDTAGRPFRSNVAIGRTAVVPGTPGVVLFADDPPGGYPIPSCYEITDVPPHADGTHHMELAIACTDGGGFTCDTPGAAAECWEHLRRDDVDVDLSGLSMGQFEQAYLEFSIAYEGDLPGFWGEVQLYFGGVWWRVAPVTFSPDGEYRRYQIPLDVFTHASDGTPLSREDVTVLDSWRVGANWTAGGVVRIDEARIRW